MTSSGDRSPLFIKDIVIDCHDLDRQVSFWSEVLGRKVLAATGPYVWLGRRDGVGLGFQQVGSARPAGKNRLHLDLGSADPAAEQVRIEQLGGRRLPGYEGSGFLVMADPEGNEFCIIPAEPFELDDEGRAEYLT